MGISLENVTLSYNRHPAVHHLTMNIEFGSMIAVLGPNGGGKSTLLKSLAGLKEVDEGKIIFSDPTQKVAYLSQLNQYDFSFPLRAIDVVLMGTLTHKGLWSKSNHQDLLTARKALQMVGLESCETKSLQQLSPGQLQRVLFARLILQDADILLLDEPFNAIDEKTTHDLCQILSQWYQEKKKTIICVLHQPDLALRYFPQSMLLAKTLTAFGKTNEILSNPNNIIATIGQPLKPDDSTKEVCEL